MGIQCGMCDWWPNSPITKVDKNKNTVRKCVAKKRRIKATSESCKYFNPTYFFCDQYQQRFPYEVCLARRRNRQNLGGYSQCKKCRQFEREIREIVEEYFLNSTPIVTPRHLARGEEKIGSGKIKRRKKKDQDKPKSKRTIKRRDKSKSNGKGRKIKRRSKSDNGLKYTTCPKCGAEAMRDDYCRVCAFKPNEKPKRKIKRRSR